MHLMVTAKQVVAYRNDIMKGACGGEKHNHEQQ